MEKYCGLNGKIVSNGKLILPINDLGVLRGFGIFEFLRTYNGRIFLAKEHLTRLEKSAKLLGLPLPYTRQEITEQIETLIKKNKMSEANIRIIVTGGPTNDAISPIGKPNFFILVEKQTEWPKSVFINGVKLITFNHCRELNCAKTLNYLTAVKLQSLRKQKNAFEILYVSCDLVLECTTSNFFIVKNNTLITAKNNVLLGTTRNFTIKLAKKFNLKIEERDLKIAEIKTADEAFLTATNKEIVPVVKIDNTKIGNGKVGPICKKLLAEFRRQVAKN